MRSNMHSTQATIGRLESALKRKRLEKNMKMKLTLRQRLRRWLMSDDADQAMTYVTSDSDEDDIQIDHESAIHFTVIPAAGGKIVQIRYYDRVKDRNNTKLHIITPDERLEEALAHIFQIEVLSR